MKVALNSVLLDFIITITVFQFSLSVQGAHGNSNIVNILQSSVAFGGTPEKALKPRQKNTKTWQRNTCAQIKNHFEGEIWTHGKLIFELNATYVFERAVIFFNRNGRLEEDHNTWRGTVSGSTNAFVHNIKDDRDFYNKIRIGFAEKEFRERTQQCGSGWISAPYLRPIIWMIPCGTAIKGNKAVLDVHLLTRQEYMLPDVPNVNPMSNCSVEYFGYKVVNLAFRKPTKQSSYIDVTDTSYLGVDGVPMAVTMHSSNADLLRRCSLTDKNDQYPWWRVDLLTLHVVKSVLVFADIEGIQIRVGGKDFNGTSADFVFNENPLCNTFLEGERINPIEVECKTPLVGRYVSIQRVSNSDEHLIVCEVEVLGFPVDFNYYGNVALHSKPMRSRDMTPPKPHPNLSKNVRTSDSEQYHWWILDMKNVAVVHYLELLIDDYALYHEISYKIQIRVGYRNFINLATTTWLETDRLCFTDDSFQVLKKTYKFFCNHLLGRFVTLQYKKEFGKTKDDNLFKHIELWAMKMQPDHSEKDFLVLPSKENKAPDDWIVNNKIIAVNEYSKIENEPRIETDCTYTVAGSDEYPWWRIKLLNVYKIRGFVIHAWEESNQRRLHDIEVRVGYDDIANAPRNRPFRENSLCFATGRSKLLNVSEEINCLTDVFGMYFSIQIVRRCSSPKICDMVEPNILNLCHVQPRGSIV